MSEPIELVEGEWYELSETYDGRERRLIACYDRLEDDGLHWFEYWSGDRDGLADPKVRRHLSADEIEDMAQAEADAEEAAMRAERLADYL